MRTSTKWVDLVWLLLNLVLLVWASVNLANPSWLHMRLRIVSKDSRRRLFLSWGGKELLKSSWVQLLMHLWHRRRRWIDSVELVDRGWLRRRTAPLVASHSVDIGWSSRSLMTLRSILDRSHLMCCLALALKLGLSHWPLVTTMLWHQIIDDWSRCTDSKLAS